MKAKFMVERTYLLPSRSLFVLEGSVIDGSVRSGMKALVAFNSTFSMACVINGVEFVRHENTEAVALTVQYEETDEGEFLQSLNIFNEEIVVSDEEA